MWRLDPSPAASVRTIESSDAVQERSSSTLAELGSVLSLIVWL